MKKHTLHGAVILSNGCAHVFLSPTGGGKSTLTVYLQKRGSQAWTDDRAELDYDTLTVFPRSDAVALREGGYRLLLDKGVLSPSEVEYDPDPGRERYYFQLPPCGQELLPLGCIWLLRRGEENWTESVQKACAVRLLMENAMDPVPITGEYLRFLNRLSEKVKGILHYRDMEFVYDVLMGEGERMNPSLFMKYTKIRLQSGQAVVVTVGGESMAPVLHNGDRVVVTWRDNYAVGDILMYDYKEEGALLHRLLEIRDGHYFCKGDNSYRLEEVTEADIYGVAIAVVRDGKEVPLVCPEGLPQSSLAVHKHLKELGLNLDALHKSELYQAYKKQYLSEEETE